MGNKNKKDQPAVHRPGEDCNCPVCMFTKSQAPGDAYDLSACPKCSSFSKEKKKTKKK